jgi:hypothetical protein
VIGGNAIENKVEAARVLIHLVGVTGNNNFVRAKAECVVLLVRRGGEYDGVSAECVSELHSHVTKPAEAGQRSCR